jgi:hypothetical protein
MSNVLELVPRKTGGQMRSLVRSGNGFYALVHGKSPVLLEKGTDYLAKNFLCLGTRDEDCPCSSCNRYGEEHPDLMVRYPSAAGNLLEADTDACIKFLEDTSMFTGKKCVVLKGAQKMTPASVGNLLKILEENIPKASIILESNSWDSVSPVLRSRCQKVFVGDDTRGGMFLRLKDEGVNTKTADELSRVGTFLGYDIVEYKDRVLEAHKALPSLLQSMLKGKASAALDKYGEFASKAKAEDLSILSDLIVSTLVDLQKITFMATSQINMPSRLEWLTELRSETSESVLEVAVNAFRISSTALPAHRRSMIIWAIAVVCEEVNLKKGTKV